MNKITIEINGDEEEYQRQIEFFWNSLNEYNEKFTNILNIEENNWKKNKRKIRRRK